MWMIWNCREVDRRTGRWCVRDEIVDNAGWMLLRWMQDCCHCTGGMWASSTQFPGPGKTRGRHATYVLPLDQAEEKRVQIDYVMANCHARYLVRNCVVKWQGSIMMHKRPMDHALIESDLDVRVRASTNAGTVEGQPRNIINVVDTDKSMVQEQPQPQQAHESEELEEGEIPG